MVKLSRIKWIPWKEPSCSVLTKHQPGTQYSVRLRNTFWRYEHSSSPQEADDLIAEIKLIFITKSEYNRICLRHPIPDLMSWKQTSGLPSITRLTSLNDVRVWTRTLQYLIKSHFSKSLSPIKKAKWMWAVQQSATGSVLVKDTRKKEKQQQ